VQIFPAGTPQFPVPVVFMVKTFAVCLLASKGNTLHDYPKSLIIFL
jgi:hypothetical protein